MNARRLVLLAVVALLVVVGDAPGGGIDDEPCPNVAGENTNTCPSATVGVPYSIRFVEREGSGCGPGRQTFHLDWGVAPPGLTLMLDGTLSGTPLEAGRFRFYVEMREPTNDPTTCAGKETQKEFTLWVRKPLAIVAPPSLLRGDVGRRVRARFRVTGGSGHVRWSLVRGRLPAGMRLLRGGSLRGAPRVPGVYRFTVEVVDTESRSAAWAGALVVRRGGR